MRHAKSGAGTCSFASVPRPLILVSVFVHHGRPPRHKGPSFVLLNYCSCRPLRYTAVMPPPTDYAEEKAKSLRGELYTSFNPQLLAERLRCSRACDRYNAAGEVSRRRLVEMWRE